METNYLQSKIDILNGLLIEGQQVTKEEMRLHQRLLEEVEKIRTIKDKVTEEFITDSFRTEMELFQIKINNFCSMRIMQNEAYQQAINSLSFEIFKIEDSLKKAGVLKVLEIQEPESEEGLREFTLPSEVVSEEGILSPEHECPECSGTGIINMDSCRECNGRGIRNQELDKEVIVENLFETSDTTTSYKDCIIYQEKVESNLKYICRSELRCGLCDKCPYLPEPSFGEIRDKIPTNEEPIQECEVGEKLRGIICCMNYVRSIFQ